MYQNDQIGACKWKNDKVIKPYYKFEILGVLGNGKRGAEKRIAAAHCTKEAFNTI